MLENASYMQRELPNVPIDDSLRRAAEDMCSQLVGTKHDITTEIDELDELLERQPSREEVARYVERIVRWLRDDMAQMHEVVTALDAAAQRDATYTRAFVLISESAANILSAFNETRAAADIWMQEPR